MGITRRLLGQRSAISLKWSRLLTFDYLVTIFIDITNKINYELIEHNLQNKVEEYNKNLELIVIYGEKNNDVNELLSKLDFDIPITIIKKDRNLPNLVNIGIGDIKFLINDVSITRLPDDIESNSTIFLGRRANIFFN